MNDIVERLQNFKPYQISDGEWFGPKVCEDAAAEIQSLRTQLKERDGLLDKNKALEDECAALRTERGALLQKPLDLAKMDSIDDDDDTSTKMIAYYWHDQAQEARDKNKALVEALGRATTALEMAGRAMKRGRVTSMELSAVNQAERHARQALNSQQGEG